MEQASWCLVGSLSLTHVHTLTLLPGTIPWLDSGDTPVQLWESGCEWSHGSPGSSLTQSQAQHELAVCPAKDPSLLWVCFPMYNEVWICWCLRSPPTLTSSSTLKPHVMNPLSCQGHTLPQLRLWKGMSGAGMTPSSRPGSSGLCLSLMVLAVGRSLYSVWTALPSNSEGQAPTGTPPSDRVLQPWKRWE